MSNYIEQNTGNQNKPKDTQILTNITSDGDKNGHTNIKENISESKPEMVTDGFCGWIIVVAAFMSCFVVGVMFISFSILYLEFIDYFGTEKGVTGWIGSLYLATGNICGIFFSVFIKQYGCRVMAIIGCIIWATGFGISSLATSIVFLYFSYGLIGGIGFNIVTLTSFVIVQQHFVKHRAVAAGIAATGISIGSLSSGPLIGYFAQNFGWRGTLLIMSAMTLQCCVFASFYRSPQIKKSNYYQTSKVIKKSICEMLKQLGKDLADFSIFRNSMFSTVCVSNFLLNFGLAMFYQHTPSRAVVLGVARYDAYLLQTAVGIATATGRIVGAIIGNFKCTDRILQYGFSICVVGILLLSTAPSVTYIWIAIVASATGFTAGCTMTIQTTVLTDIVGVLRIAKAQAYTFMFMGVGALISVPLAGLIYDRTKDYNIPYFLAGILSVLGGIFLIIGRVTNKITNKLLPPQIDEKLKMVTRL